MPRKAARHGQPAVYNSTPPTLTDGDDSALSVDSNQNLKVTFGSGATALPSPQTLSNGRKVVAAAGTAEALAASTSCKTVAITAELDNTGVIVVGGSTVVAALATRQGVPLQAGDTITIDIDNLNDVYIDSTVNGDGVTYTYTV
jgi:hypothetical protein